MDNLHARCAGLDVHKETVVACFREQVAGKVKRETGRFATTTSGLLSLLDWLESRECTHVAMEATGIYWKPVWHVLEGHFEIILANATHVRNVPGRKSDMNDATWIADLLAHGLIKGSFVPPQPIQELRDLTRTRKQLTRELVKHVHRIQKTLEDANVKLASVISDIMGASGRRIIEAIIGGKADPHELASMGDPRLQCSREQLVEALRGRVTAHHRFLLRQHMALIATLEQRVGDFDARIEEVVAPFRDELQHLATIPGVSTTSAQVILAEIGADMSRFPTVSHLLSWGTLCPRLDESAGKQRSTRIRKGATWLKPALLQAAWAATRAKNTYLQAQFIRLRARRGPKKAAVAVAASILGAAYFILRDGVDYKELGADHMQRLDKSKTAARLTKRLKALGYDVEIRPAA